MSQIQVKELTHLALAVIENEAQAISKLSEQINANFVKACELLLACSGRVIVMGMGKSGHIAGKVAATLASTGTPAFFVHPGEASHGDLGMITEKDVVLSLSYSGETPEMLLLLPLLKRLAIPLIAMTGNPFSTLAQAANVHLHIDVEKEACPLGLAPTTSTTASLVLGDALAVSLLHARGFTAEDFARSHPGGSLGKRLLLKVQEIMRTGEALPIVQEEMKLTEALLEMTRKGLGLAVVTDAQGQLTGIFTDGDLRRSLDKGVNLYSCAMKEVKTTNIKVISPDALAYDAFQKLKENQITAIVVVDQQQKLVGIVHIHDLLRAGIS